MPIKGSIINRKQVTKYFIKDRILETEKELMAAEEDLKVFRDRNRRIENSPTLLLEQQRLGRRLQF